MKKPTKQDALKIQLVILSAVGMLVSLGMAFQEGRGEMPARIYYVLNITLAVFIIGAIFRFMHWPGKNIIGSIAYILAVIMTIVLALNKDVFLLVAGILRFLLFLSFSYSPISPTIHGRW
jgi:peptidoglycan/LPS O-acetylase OafA/YrhL